MRFSRLGVIFLLAVGVFTVSNCSYYNRIMSRKDLVDGSVAYRERKFAEAEALFRRAAARDPQGTTTEGKTAQIFLARTLHSQFIGNRQNHELAEEAIGEYKKALANDANDQASYKAIASLYENLSQQDNWQNWVTERSNNQSIKPEFRAEALTGLAARQNTCANEITDTDATKKTIKKDGKDAYQFVKPANEADFTKLKQCVATGTQLIEKAMEAEPDAVKNAKSTDLTKMTDAQLREFNDSLKIFESARSYRASLTIQAMRVADMEGKADERDRLKDQADQYRNQYTELSDVARNIQNELDARKAAADAAANANANANANAKPGGAQ